MARYSVTRCGICKSGAAVDINARILSRQSTAQIARETDWTYDQVRGHKAECLPASLADAQQVAEIEAYSPEQLLGQIADVQARALKLANRVESAHKVQAMSCPECMSELYCAQCNEKVEAMAIDAKSQASALRELRATVELLAKISFAAQDKQREPDALNSTLDAQIASALGELRAIPAGVLVDDGIAEAEIV